MWILLGIQWLHMITQEWFTKFSLSWFAQKTIENCLPFFFRHKKNMINHYKIKPWTTMENYWDTTFVFWCRLCLSGSFSIGKITGKYGTTAHGPFNGLESSSPWSSSSENLKKNIGIHGFTFKYNDFFRGWGKCSLQFWLSQTCFLATLPFFPCFSGVWK